jgi:L-amino acid N-acyltransferase YncA
MPAAAYIRPADPGDVDRIAAIYAHHVRTGKATFETEPPSADEMRRRFDALAAGGFPYLVAESDGAIAGYAYAGLYRTRYAYRFTLEDSIYLDPTYAGRGIGRQLLERLVEASAARGYRQMVAVIGDSANAASIALHRACGFASAGVLPAVGFKFGAWIDSVLMQRALGEGAGSLPQEARA